MMYIKIMLNAMYYYIEKCVLVKFLITDTALSSNFLNFNSTGRNAFNQNT